MKEEQIKQYYERIEKLLNGANKETYGFVPEEIRQILINYEILQQENKQLKDKLFIKCSIINKVKQFCVNKMIKMKRNRNSIAVFLLIDILKIIEKGDSNGQ